MHAWASICTIVAQTQDQDRVSNASLAFLMGVPFVFFAGWAAADMRWRRFSEMGDLSSSFDVELRARYLLQQLDADGAMGAGRGARGFMSG